MSRFEETRTSYTLMPPRGTAIEVVGCGGTGGFVAEGLCRLLIGRPEYRLHLIDHDRVEERNLLRQNFLREDLGRFKAEALARRLASAYGRAVYYETKPLEQMPIDRGHITIGCVDNAAARERLQLAGHHTMGGYYSYCQYGGWYIDAGNAEYSGQVLIGNARANELQYAFRQGEAVCARLPLPTLQQPALLAPVPQPERPRDCAEAVAADEQSPVINRVMADLVLTFVHKLLAGTLTWMGAYIDLEAGTLTTSPATPEAVYRIAGNVPGLVKKERAVKQRVEVAV